MKIRKEYSCPLEIVHDFTRGKWKIIIIYQLNKGPNSLSGLQKIIVGISQKMLIESLNELIEFDIVTKKKSLGYPLQVEYKLTEDRGKKMVEAISIMQQIGREYMKENKMGRFKED
ncbi:MAG: helix-turn-helix domain-containing protein [Spirochaetales bacterium]|nr:helix-turn-helix domain-containing protein [Spirochaetales bacterium]